MGSAETLDRFEAGERIGEYELVMRLASGGMAELFIARRAGLEGFEKFVVLKRILPHLSGSADFVEMFLHEARIAATLEHPNIVPVFDFGRAGDDYFFVMPYVHGRDLLQILRQTYNKGLRFPTALAVRVAIAMAAGLHYAHEQAGFDGRPLGIVHRDVSPANVLVTYDGHVKVVDFGIAKAAAQTNVTQAGVRKGKAAYMSPEQCRGDALDRRADVWAIGVVLWEMTLMRRLFRGDNDLAMMNRIVNEPIEPPHAVEPQYPPALETIVMRCLQKRAEDRYPTAQALQQDLEAFARNMSLDIAAAPLGSFIVDLFGSPQVPWAGAIAAAPVASPTSVTHATTSLTAAPFGAGLASDQITDGEGALPPRPGRALGWIGAGALAGLLPVLVTAWATGRLQPAPADDPASAPAPADMPPAARASADPEELAALLNLVNQPDPKLALPYPRRHAMLQQLAAVPKLAGRVDTRLNVALDLRQAGQSADPCATYSAALSEVARMRDASLVDVVREAEIPERGEGCGALPGRRAAVLAGLVAP